MAISWGMRGCAQTPEEEYNLCTVFGSDREGRVKAFLQRLPQRTSFTAKHCSVPRCFKQAQSSKESLLYGRAKRDIAKILEADDGLTHPVGEMQRVYRLKILKTFLRATVPLLKLGAFRDILEENSFQLTDHRHMSDLVPFIVTQEQADVKAEIAGKPVSVVFDGTTRLVEALAIVVRFVDNSFAIQQWLLRLQLLTKSMTGEEIARELINTLSAEYGIISCRVLAQCTTELLVMVSP